MYSTPPWALVTGASGEIGRAISLALAERGIPLYLHYHQSPHKVEPILQACREKGVAAYALQADLRQTEQITAMFAAMIVQPLLVVNNASVDHVGLFSDVSPAQFDELIATNVRSAFFVSQAALPAMLRERFGRIVNISSLWGMTGASCEVLYSLAKGAVNSFTKALAKELAPNGITVNAVAPGAIQGGMMDRFSPEEVSMLASEIPAGRLGMPEEVAAVARFLLSAEASYVTGQIISPNGGWYA
ncbi:elongation factor P 5-aminopentanone reductase [Brevibacillus borstelensis]|uniref:elongation factor P 5-aminopentanone reductase n=1 Tax=Brevibacillus borstelensis TaxID=45462 RepID=UPI0030C1F389